MNEKEFENLIKLAKAKTLSSVVLAVEISQSSDLPNQDKRKIQAQAIHNLSSQLNTEFQESRKKSLYPFRKSSK